MYSVLKAAKSGDYTAEEGRRKIGDRLNDSCYQIPEKSPNGYIADRLSCLPWLLLVLCNLLNDLMEESRRLLK